LSGSSGVRVCEFRGRRKMYLHDGLLPHLLAAALLGHNLGRLVEDARRESHTRLASNISAGGVRSSEGG